MSPRKGLAELMGITIGRVVVKTDWHTGMINPARKSLTLRVYERKNRITLSAGDANWDSVPKHFVCEGMGS